MWGPRLWIVSAKSRNALLSASLSDTTIANKDFFPQSSSSSSLSSSLSSTDCFLLLLLLLALVM
jgi:hypothetical protein